MHERRPNTGQLVLGMLFAGAAAVAAWIGFGHDIPPHAFNLGMPAFLIVIGLTGLLAGRRR